MIPHVISKNGGAPTVEEIQAAIRVTSTRSAHKVGVYIVTDEMSGVIVEYHPFKNTCYTTPTGTDYVGVSMPNPDKYTGGPVMLISYTSNNAPVLNQVFTQEWKAYDSKGNFIVSGSGSYAQNNLSPQVWSNWCTYGNMFGGGYGWTPRLGAGAATGQRGPNDTGAWLLLSGTHIADDAHTGYEWSNYDFLQPITPSKESLMDQDESLGLVQKGYGPTLETVAQMMIRFSATLKKSSDSHISKLKTGTLPDGWNNKIKGSSLASHAFYSSPITVTHKIDEMVSDSTDFLQYPGTIVFRRARTYSYDIIVDGKTVTKTWTADGTRTITVTSVNNFSNPSSSYLRIVSHFSNWVSDESDENDTLGYTKSVSRLYNSDTGGYALSTIMPIGNLTYYQYISDVAVIKNDYVHNSHKSTETRRAHPGIVWNGVVQDGDFGNGYNVDIYKNSLVGTLPDFFKVYRQEVYKHQLVNATSNIFIGNTVTKTPSSIFDDVSLFGVTTIELSPVGLIADGAGYAATGTSLGIFPVREDGIEGGTEDGTQVELYGTAVYNFDWQTGELTFKKWKPLLDKDGNEVQSKIVDLPAGVVWSEDSINCVVTYNGLHWPDVRAYIKERDKDWKSGEFKIGKPLLYELVKAIKAG